MNNFLLYTETKLQTNRWDYVTVSWRLDGSSPKPNWPERSVLWILPAVMPGSIEHNVAVYTTIHHSIAEFKNVSCKSTSSYLHCLYLLWFLRFYFVYAMGQIIFASCYNMDTWLQHRSSPALWKQQLTRPLDSLSVCVRKWGERAHVGMPFCLGF